MIVLFRLLVVCSIAFIAVGAQAKVIKLDCFFLNLKDEKKNVFISIDTDNQTASAEDTASDGQKVIHTGRLFSDGDAYWFSGRKFGGGLFQQKFQINRSSLAFTMVLHVDLQEKISKNTFSGECVIAETKQPKI